METAGCVAALSTIAEEVIDGAFVDIGALFTGGIHLVSGITNTAVRSQHVLTGAVRTHVGILGAFVNIYDRKSISQLEIQNRRVTLTCLDVTVSAVGFARSEGTQQFEFQGIGLRT